MPLFLVACGPRWVELRRREARYGVLGVCVGSGQGVALVLENPKVA